MKVILSIFFLPLLAVFYYYMLLFIFGGFCAIVTWDITVITDNLIFYSSELHLGTWLCRAFGSIVAIAAMIGLNSSSD